MNVKKVIIGLLSFIMIVAFVQFIMKVNCSGVGKYQPFGNQAIINTTTGTVYRTEKISDDEFIWKKMIYFDKK